MEKRKYRCEYCSKKFVPNRRRIQKYCSASCRSKAYHCRKTEESKTDLKLNEGLHGVDTKNEITKKKEGMSVAGIGNAAVGTLTAELITKAFTAEHKRPATKEDIQKIMNRLGRYHLIKTIPAQDNGLRAYYDMESSSIVYINPFFTED